MFCLLHNVLRGSGVISVYCSGAARFRSDNCSVYCAGAMRDVVQK